MTSTITVRPNQSKGARSEADLCTELQLTRTRRGTVSKRRTSRVEHLEALKARRLAKKQSRIVADDPDLDPSDDGMEDIFATNDYDDDFISDNDDEEEGGPEVTRAMLPILSISSPEEAFAIVVEWLVKKKLAPGFEERAEIYTRALRKVDDQASVSGDPPEQLLPPKSACSFYLQPLISMHTKCLRQLRYRKRVVVGRKNITTE